MPEMFFRLRIDFEKRGRLRFLSHLELARALERTIRRAQLPYAISRGFNAHMRFAPGPALPVGTIGLDEHFDVWLTEYLDPGEALARLRKASVKELEITATSYVDPKAKGLQATHTHEEYEVILDSALLDLGEIADSLYRVVTAGTLTVRRGNREKVYDLERMVEEMPEVRRLSDDAFEVRLHLRATEQGSVRPEALMQAALSENGGWVLRSITRTRLCEDEQIPVAEDRCL
jgi:radical SAM-linked protein